MRKNVYLSALIAIITLSCTQDDSAFKIDEESADLSTIISAKIIDEIDDSSEVTTEYLTAKWQRELNKEGIDVSLEKFQVLETKSANGEDLYFLKAISSDGTVQTGAFLKPVLDAKNNPTGAYKMQQKTCTCKGCSTACNLQVTGDTCRCTQCPPGAPTCIKTETVTIGDQ